MDDAIDYKERLRPQPPAIYNVERRNEQPFPNIEHADLSLNSDMSISHDNSDMSISHDNSTNINNDSSSENTENSTVECVQPIANISHVDDSLNDSDATIWHPNSEHSFEVNEFAHDSSESNDPLASNIKLEDENYIKVSETDQATLIECLNVTEEEANVEESSHATTTEEIAISSTQSNDDVRTDLSSVSANIEDSTNNLNVSNRVGSVENVMIDGVVNLTTNATISCPPKDTETNENFASDLTDSHGTSVSKARSESSPIQKMYTVDVVDAIGTSSEGFIPAEDDEDNSDVEVTSVDPRGFPQPLKYCNASALTKYEHDPISANFPYVCSFIFEFKFLVFVFFQHFFLF